MSYPSPIAIDGPAAAGKGTLARKLGSHLISLVLLPEPYIGGLLLVLQAQDDPTDPQKSLESAQKLDIDKIDHTAIRSAEVGQAAADVAVHQGVRSCILDLQRHFAANPPAGKTEPYWTEEI